MRYVVDISPTAEEDIDRFIEAHRDEGLFEAIYHLEERLAQDPVGLMRSDPKSSDVPYVVGHHGRYMFVFTFRFRTDHRIEILRFHCLSLY